QIEPRRGELSRPAGPTAWVRKGLAVCPQALKGRNNVLRCRRGGRRGWVGGPYHAPSGLARGKGTEFLTQAVGLVPQGGIARPVGAESMHPGCPAKSTGEN